MDYSFYLCLLAAYLLGSIPFALLITKALNLKSIATLGSGNPGVSNMFRSFGLLPAVLTAIGDVGKGSLAVLFAIYWQLEAWQIGACAVGVVLGHILPVFHRFKGGKGVATTLGALLLLDWLLAIICLTTWLLLTLCFRIASIASLVVACLLAVWAGIYFEPYGLWLLLLSSIIVLAHHHNIAQLFKGKERKL